MAEHSVLEGRAVRGNGGCEREAWDGRMGLVMGRDSGTARADLSSSPSWILHRHDTCHAESDFDVTI